MVNVEHDCVPDEKDSQKHVYIVYFSCTWVLKMRQNNLNAALTDKRAYV